MCAMSTLLRPGIIVALSVRTEGGVRNEVLDEKTKHEGPTLVKEWRSRKIVEDEEEFKRATEVRSKARGLIRGACIPTPFAIMLCPKGGPEEEKLNARIEEAERIIEQFNLFSNHSKLRLNLIRGEVAQTDEEAAAAIRSELAGILEEMQGAIKAADPKAMRDAAARGAKLGGMLDAKTRGKAKLSAAVKSTRQIASAVLKAAGDTEAVALAIADEKASPVSLARFAFAGQGDDLGDETEEAVQERAAARITPERCTIDGTDDDGETFADMPPLPRFLDGSVPGEDDDLLEDEPAPEANFCACPVCEEQAEPGLEFCGACQEAGCSRGGPHCDEEVDPEVIRALRRGAYQRLGIPEDDLSEEGI